MIADARSARVRNGLLFGALAALAAGASLVASSSPDGLERVAADLGFLNRATTEYHAPIPDYALGTGPFSGVMPGILGTVVVGGLGFAMGRLLKRQPPV